MALRRALADLELILGPEEEEEEDDDEDFGTLRNRRARRGRNQGRGVVVG